MQEISRPPQEEATLRRWQSITVALLFIGYSGYYLCRSHLSVVTPLLIKEFGHQGIDKTVLGGIASMGTLAYAFGKFLSGSLSDFLGGRKMFLLGMGGAVLFTLLFGLGGAPFFMLTWILNRLIQSLGWSGIVKITSRWFGYSAYGTVMGLISLSFLFGDFLSRLFLGQLIEWHLGWRGVFYTAAGILAIIFVATFFLLKESPRQLGLEEPKANPANLFGEEGQHGQQAGLGALLAPLMRSEMFWAVCALSLGFTLVRETFLTWTPQYLTEVVKMEPGAAAKASSFFPFFGGLSVLFCGFLSDRLGRSGRAALILYGLLLSIPALLILGYAPIGTSATAAVLALGAVAFFLLGPYSFLGGAIALDFGGKRGSATACGWIDGVGYLGGVLAGKGIGAIAQTRGWPSAFLALAGVTTLSCFAAAFYWSRQRWPLPPRGD